MARIDNTLQFILAVLPTSAVAKFFILLLGLIFAYTITLSIYRLYFAPLAGFPGSKFAAITGWYECYYDIVKPGKFLFEIEKMHKKYGPIIRINPHELSIHDPKFYSEVYVSASVRRTEHYSHFAEGLGFEGSHIFTTPHDLHRRRRKPLEPFFSRLGVTRLEPILVEFVRKLSTRFEALKGSGTIIRLDHVFSALTADVMNEVLYGGLPSFLEEKDFSPYLSNIFHNIIVSAPVFIQFPFFVRIVGLIPKFVLAWAFPESQGFEDLQRMSTKQIVIAHQERLDSEKQKTDANARVSLFRHILKSDMPESELSVERLSIEGQILLGAGTVSTSRTLIFISYYILANEQIRIRLSEELGPLMAGYPEKVPSWSELEKLPFLQALIKESLRLSYGVTHRLPRVSPDTPLKYENWTIPAGVPVGMSAYLMHTDPAVYPDPFEFKPERWLGNIDPLMNRNYVPFTRGSRNCLGINLVYAEINLILAMLFRPHGPVFELHDTDETDVTPVHDFLLPLPKVESKGVRAVFS